MKNIKIKSYYDTFLSFSIVSFEVNDVINVILGEERECLFPRSIIVLSYKY